MDGLAPVGAWVAITNELPWEAWVLGAAVAFWVAGFDLLYALFDLDVDRAQGLHSFPARFGVPATFRTARACHVLTVAFLALAGLGLPVGPSLLDRRRRGRRPSSPTSTRSSRRATSAGSTRPSSR